MSQHWMSLVIGAGLLALGLAGCASPSLQQGRIGNLEYALVEVRDKQDRLTEEFRERLDSMELALLQQEHVLQDVLAAQGPTKPVVKEPSRQAPEPSPAKSLPFETDQSVRTPSEPPPPQTQEPEIRPAPTPRPQPSEPASSRTPNEAKELYDQALANYYRGEYAQARADFLDFQERFPGHPLMPNALYWQAETHYAQKQFAQSILVFKELSRRFPKSAKAPDALLKAGFAYEQLGDYPNALFHLQIVISDYPGSPASRLARERLPQLPTTAS